MVISFYETCHRVFETAPKFNHTVFCIFSFLLKYDWKIADYSKNCCFFRSGNAKDIDAYGSTDGTIVKNTDGDYTLTVKWDGKGVFIKDSSKEHRIFAWSKYGGGGVTQYGMLFLYLFLFKVCIHNRHKSFRKGVL